ncbi:MAG: DMT family transporter [Pseudomonadota bacterium]
MSGARSGAGVRYALAAVTLFALQDGISTHLANTYPVPFFVMIRYWFFALFVLAVASRMPGGVSGAARTKRPVLQAFRGVLLVLQILAIVSSMGLIGLAATQSIFALHPLIVTLLAIPILGERVGWRRLAAVGVGFAGVLVIVRPGGAVFQLEAAVAVLGAVMFSVYGVLTRLANREDGHSRASFFYTGIAGAAAITLIGPFFWTSMAWADWGWLLVLSITAMTGHYFLIRALDATEAYRIQPLVYLQMVFGIGVGFVVFDEPVDTAALLGVLMIIAAGLYVIWREYRLMRASEPEG